MSDPGQSRGAHANKRPLIAVDGPAASGKGTIAKALGSHFGVPYLDTGALYRGVALDLSRKGWDQLDADMASEAAAQLDANGLSDPALRRAEIGALASKVAAIPAVRAALLQFQRTFAANERGAVLDGRDIGTVICPDAPAKLFVQASLEERARRRHLELNASGGTIAYETVLADLQERDLRDSTRSQAPLTRADDADLLDTTKLSIEAAIAAAIDLVSRKLASGAV
jgi:cytidylate kinase